MSAIPTPLGIAVLALLREQPMHPYEMYQLLRERHEDQLVKVRPGSLYHTVERLADHDLVRATGTERAGNRPERTTYEITDAGATALISRVSQILREPVNEFPQFPVALGEAHNLPLDEFVDLIGRRVSDLDTRIAEIGLLIGEARDREVPEAYWFAADYLRAMHQTERDWIDTLIKRLHDEDLTWPYDKT